MHKATNWEAFERTVGFGLVGAVIFIVTFTSACLWFMFVSKGIAAAALPKPELASGCAGQIAQVALAGTFEMKGNTKMRVLVGHKATGNRNVVTAVLSQLGGKSANTCLAECHMVRFERYQGDHAPSLLEFECEGLPIRTMRMPLHIQWLPDGARVRMGSSIFRTDEAKLKVELDRYKIAAN